jgi:hypothetical protein
MSRSMPSNSLLTYVQVLLVLVLFHVLGERKAKLVCLGEDNNCWSGSAIGRDVCDFCHFGM